MSDIVNAYVKEFGNKPNASDLVKFSKRKNKFDVLTVTKAKKELEKHQKSGKTKGGKSGKGTKKSDKSTKKKDIKTKGNKDSKKSNKSEKKDEKPKPKPKAKKEKPKPVAKYSVDDEVLLTKDRMGIVRFVGEVKDLGDELYFGIELLNGAVGTSDGVCKGQRYFQTDGDRALFVTETKIRRKMTARDRQRSDSFINIKKEKLKEAKSDKEEASSPIPEDTEIDEQKKDDKLEETETQEQEVPPPQQQKQEETSTEETPLTDNQGKSEKSEKCDDKIETEEENKEQEINEQEQQGEEIQEQPEEPPQQQEQQTEDKPQEQQKSDETNDEPKIEKPLQEQEQEQEQPQQVEEPVEEPEETVEEPQETKQVEEPEKVEENKDETCDEEPKQEKQSQQQEINENDLEINFSVVKEDDTLFSYIWSQDLNTRNNLLDLFCNPKINPLMKDVFGEIQSTSDDDAQKDMWTQLCKRWRSNM